MKKIIIPSLCAMMSLGAETATNEEVTNSVKTSHEALHQALKKAREVQQPEIVTPSKIIVQIQEMPAQPTEQIPVVQEFPQIQTQDLTPTPREAFIDPKDKVNSSCIKPKLNVQQIINKKMIQAMRDLITESYEIEIVKAAMAKIAELEMERN